MIYMKDSNRKLRKINNTFLNMLPYEYVADDIIGKKMIDLFGRMEIEDIIKAENSVFKTGEPVLNKKIRLPGAKGRKSGLISIHPIFDKKNKIIEIVVSIQDISEQLETLEKLNQFITILDNLDYCFWIVSYPPYKNEFYNKKIQEISGVSKDEITSDPSKFFNFCQYENTAKVSSENMNYNILKPPLGKHIVYMNHKDGTLKKAETTNFETRIGDKTFWYGFTKLKEE
jgi:hypothetical protein